MNKMGHKENLKKIEAMPKSLEERGYKKDKNKLEAILRRFNEYFGRSKSGLHYTSDNAKEELANAVKLVQQIR
ncbi:MAG: hypothetical protein ABIE23_01935 [archaeon]